MFSKTYPNSSLPRFISSMAVVLALAVVPALAAHAQITSGNIAGTVKDASGALLPKATVKVTNEATGVSVTTDVSSSGGFLVQNLLPGDYDVIRRQPADSHLRSFVASHVDLNVTVVTASPVLAAGSQATTVEVSADSSALLDTTSQNLTTSFSNVEVGVLPTASVGVGVLNLSLLGPGVASTGGLGIGVGPSIAGQRPRDNNFTVEGIDNNNKAVTGPLVYLPNDAVGNFTLITSQFSPEFGHSAGGQFNTTVLSGTNAFHGRVYEYFQNRDLNAASGIAGGKVPNPRYDNNRYGAQLGGPILKDKLFFFANYERNTIGQNSTYYLCAPTAAGISLLNSNSAALRLQRQQPRAVSEVRARWPTTTEALRSRTPTITPASTSSERSSDVDQSPAVAAAATTAIPLGNYLVSSPYFTNFSTPSPQRPITPSLPRTRFAFASIDNKQASQDTAATLPTFLGRTPNQYYLATISEYHTFTPNLINEARVGFNRYANTLGAGSFSFPGLDVFPANLQFYDQGFIGIGPDGNAPQFTIQNLYQFTDNVSYTKGNHTLKFGFDGRKYISPQGFTQRARGDYEWANLDQYLHDLAPDSSGFAERSTGSQTYYGDQTALYGYGNDTWRLNPKLTVNVGLRYEFTSVPTGERAQSLERGLKHAAGLITFNAPQPAYKSFAPRIGLEYAPNTSTVVRAWLRHCVRRALR